MGKKSKNAGIARRRAAKRKRHIQWDDDGLPIHTARAVSLGSNEASRVDSGQALPAESTKHQGEGSDLKAVSNTTAHPITQPREPTQFQPQQPSPGKPDPILRRWTFQGRTEVEITNSDLLRLEPSVYLNDTLIDFGLKHQWAALPDKADSARIFGREDILIMNSHFYRNLSECTAPSSKDSNAMMSSWPGYDSVRKWTRKTDVFNKNLLIVPINEKLHWYCAIILKPGAILTRQRDPDTSPGNSKAAHISTAETEDVRTGEIDQDRRQEADMGFKRPIIMTFDSLGNSHRHVAKLLNKWLVYEARDKAAQRTTLKETDWDLKFPAFYESVGVPVQDNSADCGIYLIHYANQLMQDDGYLLGHILKNSPVKSDDDRKQNQNVWNATRMYDQREIWKSVIMRLPSVAGVSNVKRGRARDVEIAATSSEVLSSDIVCEPEQLRALSPNSPVQTDHKGFGAQVASAMSWEKRNHNKFDIVGRQGGGSGSGSPLSTTIPGDFIPSHPTADIAKGSNLDQTVAQSAQPQSNDILDSNRHQPFLSTSTSMTVKSTQSKDTVTSWHLPSRPIRSNHETRVRGSVDSRRCTHIPSAPRSDRQRVQTSATEYVHKVETPRRFSAPGQAVSKEFAGQQPERDATSLARRQFAYPKAPFSGPFVHYAHHQNSQYTAPGVRRGQHDGPQSQRTTEPAASNIPTSSASRARDKRSRKRRRMYGSEESDDNWEDQEAFRGIAEDPELDRMIDDIYIPELGVRPIFGTGFNKNRTLQRNAQAQRDSERYWASCRKT